MIRFRNEATDSPELLIYDFIGTDWFGEGTTAKGIAEQVSKITANQIVVRINSPGGDVFDGFAIFQALLAHKARIIVHIDGVAASIASVIAMAGDEVHMTAPGFVMIHEASSLVIGSAEDMKREAAALEKVSEQIADVYAKRIGKTNEEMRTAMKAETWYTSKEAIALGLATHVFDVPPRESTAGRSERMAACVRNWKKAPPEALALVSAKGKSMSTPKNAPGPGQDPTPADPNMPNQPNQPNYGKPDDVIVCKLPTGDSKDMTRAECEAAGGEIQDSAVTPPVSTSPAASNPLAASLAEFKAAIPHSTAEQREKWLEKGVTVAQASAEFHAVQTEKIASLEKTVGELATKVDRLAGGGRAVDYSGGRGESPTNEAELRSKFDAQKETKGGIKDFAQFAEIEKKTDAAFRR